MLGTLIQVYALRLISLPLNPTYIGNRNQWKWNGNLKKLLDDVFFIFWLFEQLIDIFYVDLNWILIYVFMTKV